MPWRIPVLCQERGLTTYANCISIPDFFHSDVPMVSWTSRDEISYLGPLQRWTTTTTNNTNTNTNTNTNNNNNNNNNYYYYYYYNYNYNYNYHNNNNNNSNKNNKHHQQPPPTTATNNHRQSLDQPTACSSPLSKAWQWWWIGRVGFGQFEEKVSSQGVDGTWDDARCKKADTVSWKNSSTKTIAKLGFVCLRWSPWNHHLGKYFLNFFQASNKRIYLKHRLSYLSGFVWLRMFYTCRWSKGTWRWYQHLNWRWVTNLGAVDARSQSHQLYPLED